MGNMIRGAKITPDPTLGGVISNALKYLGQDDATQGKVFVIEDKMFQRGHMRQIATCEEVDPDAGANENHRPRPARISASSPSQLTLPLSDRSFFCCL